MIQIGGGGGAATPAGSDTQVQFNDGGAFGGNSGLVFDKTTGKLTVGKQLVISSGAVTASTPLLDLAQTWNSAGTTFTGLKFNVTDTASAAGSLLADLQVGGASKLKIGKDGTPTIASGRLDSGTTVLDIYANSGSAVYIGTAGIAFGNRFLTFGSGAASAGGDTTIARDAANTLAQRNGVNAQTFRVYNTFTDASNYERGKIAWAANVLQVGTEKAGTGTARALELQTDGTTRLTIAASGAITVNAGVTFSGYTDWGTFGSIKFVSSGVMKVSNTAETDFNRLQLGGTTSSFPAIKRNAAAINFRVADDSADADITAKAATFSGNVTVSTVNIVTDTTTGTKIGTATTQKLGFYNATPVVQPAAVADATGAGDVVAQLNLLLARMRDLGLIAP